MLGVISSDDVESLSRMFRPDELFLTSVPVDCPKILTQWPSLTGVASYFGAHRCLEFLLNQGLDVFTPDKKGVFLFLIVFQLILPHAEVAIRCCRFYKIIALILGHLTVTIQIRCIMQRCLRRFRRCSS